MNQGVNPMKFEDVVCRREAGSAVVESVQQEWGWHNSAGFEWGNGGSGPAYLALNILLAATGDRDFAARHHQDFKWRYVAKLPFDGGVIPAAEIREWVAERTSGLALVQ